MFVAELDRSWLHTPFSRSGFLITRDMQIHELARLCHYVYIDPEKSDDLNPAAYGRAANDPDVPVGMRPANPDLVRARAVLDTATTAAAGITRDVRRDENIRMASLDRSARSIIDSVRTCPDALLWLTRTNFDPGYLYRRCVGSAILAALLGKRLGLDTGRLIQMVLGGLLLDIGKTAVPITILAKPGALNSAERHFTERHVRRSYSIVRIARGCSERIVEMVLGHHERLDGSGYPRRLRGTDIPLFARMAGMIDTFDALTLDRRYALAMSPHAALRHLHSARNRKFDAAIVQEFIHAVGVYPTGSTIGLSDGRAGIVCAQNPDAPLYPRVAVTSDVRLQPLAQVHIMDTDRSLRISRALQPGSLHFSRAQLDLTLNTESGTFR